MRYEILSGRDVGQLMREVELGIKEGLKPFGSMVYVPYQQWGEVGYGGTIEAQFYQPMIAED